MIRKIIEINEEKCNGCGACAAACHEGAIAMIDGVARLIRDDYCDGLGNCLPVCPTDAISFVEREADAYDEAAVLKNQELLKEQTQKEEQKMNKFMNRQGEPLACGCPGTQSRRIERQEELTEEPVKYTAATSELRQWPVQIKLAPVNAPYFDKANLLIAADCSAYAFAGFHGRFMKNKVTLIGCPKLDEGDYTEKLTEIIRNNDIKSVTVTRMEVPCCGGIENAVKNALMNSGKFIPWQVVTISTDGKILE
ncbi:MAG: 4Fe-4S binding protein [Lachnospiraceae bacterium]